MITYGKGEIMNKFIKIILNSNDRGHFFYSTLKYHFFEIAMKSGDAELI